MKKMNKLVALLLAAVMVLGMMPTMTVHAHEYHTHGVEEYPVLTLDTPATAAIGEAGSIAYFAFTPEVTDYYHYYSTDTTYIDTYGALYDADFNLLNYNDDASWGNALGVTNSNFLISQVLEAGTTYIMAARLYSSSKTGSFDVVLTNGHSYTSAVTKEPTCSEDGVLTYTCSYCGATYEEAIPAAHIWGEDGKCTLCGDTYLITGTCGDDLTWSLDWFGKMTISGTGDMYDYYYSWEGNTPSPWYDAYNGDITSVVIEEGCTSVGSYAFYQCTAMTELSLPSTVTTIGDHAFQNTGMTTLTVPNTVTTIEAGAFSSNYNLTEATLPSGLTAIPDNCFAYCGALETIHWPAAVTSIGDNALYSCNLSDLVIPEGVTYIGEYAVGGNSNMTTLTLPTTLTEIAPYAFSSCYNTSNFIFKGNAPTIGTNAFSWVTTTVWYPAGDATWTADIQQNYGGTLTWKALCTEHTWGEWTTVAATCTVGEYQTRSCTVCGWTENTEPGEPLGHDYVETVIEPDCATWNYGRTEVTCTRCDYYETKDWVPYEHTYEAVVTEATCTTDGYTTYTCTKCGNYYTDSYVYATGHSVAEWSEPSEATCTEASVKTGVCANCNETVSEEVSPALGHTWDEENYVENEDGSKTYTCTVCGDTYRTEGTFLYLGDNEFSIAGGSGRTTKTYTAAEAGTLTITMENMVYHNAYAYEQGWCEYWQQLGISWAFSEGFFNVYINGTNTGYTSNGDHTVILNSIEVNAGDVVTVEVNHTEASYYRQYDAKCNMNLTLEPAAPAVKELVLGDNLFEIPADTTEMSGTWTAEAAGTLTVKFASIYYYDAWWAEMFPEDDPWTEMPIENALGSNYYSLSVNGTAVSSVDGTTIDIAAGDVVTVVVGNGYSSDTKATVNLTYGEPHTHSYEAVVTEPTCTEGGYTTYTCSCGDSYVADETEALGHDYVVTEVVEPTCTKGGYSVYTCTRCGKSYKDDPTEPEHKWGEGVVTEPTCTEMGCTTYTCLVCGFEYEDEAGYTPALGHDYVNGECTRCDAVKDAPFTDVPAGAFYFDPVEWAVEKGITTGATETTFDPNGKCLRAAVVTFLWRAAGEPEPTTTVNPFTDVNETDFFYKAVLWAVEEGITNGTTATTFSPYAECNRAAVVTFLYRAMGEPEVTATSHPFTDVDEEMFYFVPMLWAVENGITTGLTNTTFGPTVTCNRAQVVTFLYRAMA